MSAVIRCEECDSIVKKAATDPMEEVWVCDCDTLIVVGGMLPDDVESSLPEEWNRRELGG